MYTVMGILHPPSGFNILDTQHAFLCIKLQNLFFCISYNVVRTGRVQEINLKSNIPSKVRIILKDMWEHKELRFTTPDMLLAHSLHIFVKVSLDEPTNRLPI
jgi:hypothetical protein